MDEWTFLIFILSALVGYLLGAGLTFLIYILSATCIYSLSKRYKGD